MYNINFDVIISNAQQLTAIQCLFSSMQNSYIIVIIAAIQNIIVTSALLYNMVLLITNLELSKIGSSCCIIRYVQYIHQYY